MPCHHLPINSPIYNGQIRKIINVSISAINYINMPSIQLSMEVDKELLKKVGEVARIKLTGNEITRFIPQVKDILEYFSVLNEVDTKGVKPSFQPIELKNRLREDKADEPLSQKDALKNSSQNQEGYFKGPKAV